MNEKMVALAKMTSAPRLKDLDAPLALGVAEARAKLHGHGRLFIIVTQRYQQDISERAQICWESLLRAHKSVGAPLTEDLRGVLEGAFRAELDAVVIELRPRFDKDMAGAPQSSKERDWPSRLGDTRDHEFDRYRAEIEHYVTSLEATRERGTVAPTSYVFHGHVGAVVTGAGANANVIQNITSVQREELLKALSLVKDVIARAPELPANDRQELGELVEDAAGEVGKERPNTRRLTMLLKSLAAAVQGIASGPQAGEVLRAAATAIGIGW